MKTNTKGNLLHQLIILIITFILSLSLVSCDDSQDNKMIVAVSIVPECTFVQKVCGDLVSVVTMIPPGASPETTEPQLNELLQFEKASLYFSIGVPTEKDNILPYVSQSTKVISLADEVKNAYDDVYLESGGRDPHIWLSPKRVIVMVNTILREMISLDPENTDKYQENAEAFIKELKLVDLEIKDAISNSPVKEFIVYHPAFGYLASDYGLVMHALELNGKEATPEHLINMQNYALVNNIKVIFYQAENAGSQSQAFAEKIQGKSVKLDPLSADYIENLRQMAKAIAWAE